MTDVSDTLDMTVHHLSDGSAVLTVTGNVDLHTSPTLRAHALALVDEGVRHLVLDLARVDFVDSTGLSTFITILQATRRRDGSLRLAAVPDRLMRMMTMTGISQLLPVHATVDEAVAAGPAAATVTDVAGPDAGTAG
ncbi:STAS domain-containing protein [Streptomyces sp. NPDC003456]|uniref:STAS domain-containing protein n=1 Tax=Streptomyces sp. NPDC003456 TaxID=3364683 RepID=UPI0036AFCCF8